MGEDMRIGPLLGFENSMETVVTVAREMEAAGAFSVMLAEASRSAVTQAAAVIAATERVQVGTYVVNAFGRSPWLTGLAARDLDEMSEGRFVLGIGTGNPNFNNWYMDIDSSRPMSYMRDYVEIVRKVVRARAGERVSYDGASLSMKKWRASHEPFRSSVPVYLAASGANMMKLAAEISDGIGVGIMASVEFMENIVRPNALAAITDVGRGGDELVFPMGTLISVNQDGELARNAMKAAVCGLFHPVPHPYYDLQIRRQGFPEVADMLSELVPAGRTSEAMKLIPDVVIETMTIAGTPTECASRVKEYEGVVDQIVTMSVPQRDQPSGVAAYADLFELVSIVGSI
jgi:5,10-methylenetetrahydromethanopterin reductase